MKHPYVVCVCIGIGAILPACQPGPVQTSSEAALRRSLADMIRRELGEPGASPARQITTSEASEEAFVREFELQEFVDQLRGMAGPASYEEFFADLPMGENLFGEEHQVIGLTLDDAIALAVNQNLQVQFARLSPAINAAQVAEAEAAFDWTFFTNLEFQDNEQPIVDRASSGFGIGGDFRRSTDVALTTGVRRLLTSGGQLTLQQELGYNDSDERGLTLTPNPANRANLTAQFDQPLLRNFGSHVALAQVRINRNAERNAVASLQQELNQTVTETERAYWQLVQAYYDLLILQRLVDRGEEVLQQIVARRAVDVNQAQRANAAARLEDRKADVLRARNAVRRASDRLKTLINRPDLPVSGETLIVPLDAPLPEAIEFSLADAIGAALEHRPEIAQAILSIDDTTIRQIVADNARLPQLDLRVQLSLQSLEDDLRTAYATAVDREFFSAVIGLFYEVPIGNRAAESVFRRRLLERQQAVVSFENTVQQVILEVKNALDNLTTNYRLIEQERINRIAAAESLRVLQVQKEKGQGGYTIERLETELNQQERLANAERGEIQALVDYAISLAESHRAMGTTLQRNRIDFVVPDAPGEVPDRPLWELLGEELRTDGTEQSEASPAQTPHGTRDDGASEQEESAPAMIEDESSEAPTDDTESPAGGEEGSDAGSPDEGGDGGGGADEGRP